jgi:Holliday junction resolvase-like predicted endonuclease
MELYEHIVMAYLTKDPFVFVSHQYSIRNEKSEWSCPDFVALDFRNRRVAVVEVSTAWNTKSLLEKVENREVQWIDKLRRQLLDQKIIDQQWKFEIEVYVRKHAVPSFKSIPATTSTPIKVAALEDIGSPWDWQRA